MKVRRSLPAGVIPDELQYLCCPLLSAVTQERVYLRQYVQGILLATNSPSVKRFVGALSFSDNPTESNLQSFEDVPVGIDNNDLQPPTGRGVLARVLAVSKGTLAVYYAGQIAKFFVVHNVPSTSTFTEGIVHYMRRIGDGKKLRIIRQIEGGS